MMNHIHIFVSSAHYFYNHASNITSDNLISDIKKCKHNFKSYHILITILLLFVISKSRYFFQKWIFTNICNHLNSAVKTRSQVYECGWKLIIHTNFAVIAITLLSSKYCNNCFSNASLIWRDYSINADIPLYVTIFYLAEISHYMYGFYCILFNTMLRRKDTNLLLFHHIVAIILLSAVHYSGLHKFGVIGFALHDFNDVFYESGKFLYYLRQQNGIVNINFKRSAELCGLLLAVTWFITRIYYFPLKVLVMIPESASFGINALFPLIAILLWFVYIMDIIWFIWISTVYYKLFTGQIKEMIVPTSLDNKNE